MPLLLLTCSKFLLYNFPLFTELMRHIVCIYWHATNPFNRKELIAKYEAELDAKRTK